MAGNNTHYYHDNTFEELKKLNPESKLIIDRFLNYVNFNQRTVYGRDEIPGFKTIIFQKPLIKGGKNYYCPIGWRKYSINLRMTGPEFENKYYDWPLAYHGTESYTSLYMENIDKKRSVHEICGLNADIEGCVKLSPSVEYASHPCFAPIWKTNDKYVQMLLQVRVKKSMINDQRPGTIPGSFNYEPAMDSNFKDNSNLEWLVKWPPGKYLTDDQGIVVCGIMLRVTGYHPGDKCSWWKRTENIDWNFSELKCGVRV